MSDRVALLVGASAGIGFAVADLLAADGMRIVLASRRPEEAAGRLAARYDVEVLPVPCDVAEPAAARDCVAAATRLGRLDALLLNHGGPPVTSFENLRDDDWRAWFEIMVVGPLRLLRACLPVMRKSGGGRVVAVSSFTVKAPYPGVILSNALRAALVNALKTVAADAGRDGILVNGVGPGFTATERVRSFNTAQAERRGIAVEEVVDEVTAQIALGRFGEPEDVAELIAFLLSPRNHYVTGQHVLADGGLVLAT